MPIGGEILERESDASLSVSLSEKQVHATHSTGGTCLDLDRNDVPSLLDDVIYLCLTASGIGMLDLVSQVCLEQQLKGAFEGPGRRGRLDPGVRFFRKSK